MHQESRQQRRPSQQGASAYLTVSTLLCGFSFAGVVLYLGTSQVTSVHVVAACFLVAAFILLLYAAFADASLIDVHERMSSTTVWHYWSESCWSLLLGLVLLLSAVCIMAFDWSVWVGGTGTALSVAFVLRFAWAASRELTLG